MKVLYLKSPQIISFTSQKNSTQRRKKAIQVALEYKVFFFFFGGRDLFY